MLQQQRRTCREFCDWASLTNRLNPDIIFLRGEFNAGHRYVTATVYPEQWGEALSILRAQLGAYAISAITTGGTVRCPECAARGQRANRRRTGNCLEVIMQGARLSSKARAPAFGVATPFYSTTTLVPTLTRL
jgi:predicted MPP superfamily phosphohydrolase